MAKVTVGQAGGDFKSLEASSVGEAVKAYGLEGDYTIKVNGQSSSMTASLSDEDFISIGDKVKGGAL